MPGGWSEGQRTAPDAFAESKFIKPELVLSEQPALGVGDLVAALGLKKVPVAVEGEGEPASTAARALTR